MALSATKGWKYRCTLFNQTYADGGTNGWTGAASLFVSRCTMRGYQDNFRIPGTRGSRATYYDQMTKGAIVAGGQIAFKFGRAELDTWLPLILGASQASDVFRTAEELPQFCLLVDKGQGQFFLYSNCKVARATFGGQAGGVVTMTIDVTAEQELVWSTVPQSDGQFVTVSYTPSSSTKPLRFGEGDFRIRPASSPYIVPFSSFGLTIDNGLEPMFYAGSDYATAIDEGFRSVRLQVPAAHSSVTAPLYSLGADGLAARLKFTNGNMSTQFDFGSLVWPQQSPGMESETDGVPLMLDAFSCRTESGSAGVDDDIVVTNDPTA